MIFRDFVSVKCYVSRSYMTTDAGGTDSKFLVVSCEGGHTASFDIVPYANFGIGDVTVFCATTLSHNSPAWYGDPCPGAVTLVTYRDNYISGHHTVNISGYNYLMFSWHNGNDAYAGVEIRNLMIY